jgi:class 3 adenylate cyclase
VLISEATRERLGDAAASRPLGPMALKGKDDDVEVFELVEVGAAP